MYSKRCHFLVVVILISALSLGGCVSGPRVSQEGVPSVAATYTLPLLPIQITYDFISKKIGVSISGKIQTPIGTFGISTGMGVVEKKFDGVRTLIIEAGKRRYIYKLEKGRPYRISLPSDENGKTEVNYPGTDDNLIITIPNPTNETVAELKEKLKEEQEAHKLDESEAQSQSGRQGNATDAAPSGPGAALPTPMPRQELTTEQCKELVSKYTPDQFLYVPPECQDMLEAYKRHLQEQEYAKNQKRQEEQYERERQAERRRVEAEEAARRKQQQIEQWGNVIGNILRRRRR